MKIYSKTKMAEIVITLIVAKRYNTNRYPAHRRKHVGCFLETPRITTCSVCWDHQRMPRIDR